MNRQMTWPEAIQAVLKEAGQLHYADITERIISEGMRTEFGATPAATVAAQISASIKHEGANSPYRRVDSGIYRLAEEGEGLSVQKVDFTPDASLVETDATEIQFTVVKSFGMYWRRELVSWSSRNVKLLGRQPKASITVDLSQQYGIYLLYDGREVIYVGRTTDRALGHRIWEHTSDRHAARWDRFSWFGFLPVSGAGVLGAPAPTYSSDAVIPAIEAILIEAVEPRQNRKRGDDLSTVEYIQVEDPDLERMRLAKGINEVLYRSPS